MSTITVFGGAGYAGRHIVDEAARRGHQVIAVSRSAGDADGATEITWTSADVTDAEAVRAAIAQADVVVSALSPRGGLDGALREADRLIADTAAETGKELFVVGGFSSLRRSADAPRVIDEGFDRPDEVPAEQVEALLREASQMNSILLDLEDRTDDLAWTFLSPGMGFGAHLPGEPTGAYRIGTDGLVLLDADGQTSIGGADFALAVVDLIDDPEAPHGHLAIAY